MSEHRHFWEQKVGRDGIYWHCLDCWVDEEALDPNAVADLQAEVARLKVCGNCENITWTHDTIGTGAIVKSEHCGAYKGHEHVICFDHCHFTPPRWAERKDQT